MRKQAAHQPPCRCWGSSYKPMTNYGIPRRPPSKWELALEEYRKKVGHSAAQPQIRQSYVIDGNVFESKSEALRHMRRPLLSQLTTDSELAEWLLDHQRLVENCFWASDEGMGEAMQLLLRIPNATEQRAGWIIENRRALLRAYVHGQRHELERDT